MHELQNKLLSYFENNSTSGKSLRQIALDIDEKPQPQRIKHHIDQLIKKGLVRLEDGNYKLVKAYESTEQGYNLISIPILGTANCGPATMYASENLEGFIKVSRSLLPKRNINSLFAMKASGSSMNQASIGSMSIQDGDYVIVNPQDKDISNGNYVLSIIDGLANIKKFYLNEQGEEIVLSSESSQEAPPIVINASDVDYVVNGKIIKVIKQIASSA